MRLLIVDDERPARAKLRHLLALQEGVGAVVALDKGDGELLLRGGARVPCSRQYRADVMARLV